MCVKHENKFLSFTSGRHSKSHSNDSIFFFGCCQTMREIMEKLFLNGFDQYANQRQLLAKRVESTE